MEHQVQGNRGSKDLKRQIANFEELVGNILSTGERAGKLLGRVSGVPSRPFKLPELLSLCVLCPQAMLKGGWGGGLCSVL